MLLAMASRLHSTRHAWLVRARSTRSTGSFAAVVPAEAEPGFTLIELLVSSLILAVAVFGSVASFNLITQSAQGTGIRLDQSRLIDADLATITYRSEKFTSCNPASPTGADPADPTSHCNGQNNVKFGNSYYYFPQVSDGDDPSTWTNAIAFDAACADGTIRSNFITALGGQIDLANNVRRLAPAAVNGTDHLVRITWVDPTRNNRELRSVELASVVSAWCS